MMIEFEDHTDVHGGDRMTLWRIYHRDREYAQEHGDPCLGEVLAANKDEAERIATSRWYLPTGAWAVRS